MKSREQESHSHPLEQVKCEVTSCIYNDHADKCTAKQIKVCNMSAQSAYSLEDTACETYENGE